MMCKIQYMYDFFYFTPFKAICGTVVRNKTFPLLTTELLKTWQVLITESFQDIASF